VFGTSGSTPQTLRRGLALASPPEGLSA
jgi:hypothetical protein